MSLDVLEYICLDRPAEEIQFADCGEEGFTPRKLKLNTFTAAIGVEILFTICL